MAESSAASVPEAPVAMPNAAPGADGPAESELSEAGSRSRILAAIAASNLSVLMDVLASQPQGGSPALEAEVRAGRAMAEALEKLDKQTKDLEQARTGASDAKAKYEAEAKLRIEERKTAEEAAADQSASLGEARAQVASTRGQAPASSEEQLQLVAQAARIDDLQATIVSLQTAVRQSEMKGQQLQLELANAKEAMGPTIKAMKAVEEELAHKDRLLRTSEAASATLTNQLAMLQQRMSGVAIGEFRPAKPTRPAEAVMPPSHTEGAPTLSEPPGMGGDVAAAEGAAADGAAAEGGAAVPTVAEQPGEAEELPESVDELQRCLQLERSRVRLLTEEVRALRDEMDHQLERQRRGADRGMREMQTEFARLHRATADMREGVNAAEARAKGEEGFRRRAEQGWLTAQNSLERTQAELQQSHVKVASALRPRRACRWHAPRARCTQDAPPPRARLSLPLARLSLPLACVRVPRPQLAASCRMRPSAAGG